jgi:trans-aconitate methyltransferase
MTTLAEVEKDFAYSQGFLETWVETETNPVVKNHLKEHLENVLKGFTFYREKFTTTADALEILRGHHNTLTATSAQYLQVIQQQKELIDQQLVDSQKEFHQKFIET